MDMLKYYSVTHINHVLCNPLSEEKHGELLGLFKMAPGQKTLEIASGKGAFTIGLAQRYGVRALGVDISPYFIEEARARLSDRAPDAEVEFRCMNGADYRPGEPGTFDLTACIGASWIFKGHRGTLDFLAAAARPGGFIVAGEPYWKKEPSAEYLAFSGQNRDDFQTHRKNVETGEEMGLGLLHVVESSTDDWNRYEGLQWLAADEYARSHPGDPDLPEILEKVGRGRREYLTWGRETLGWAIYVFRKPGP
jgi:SAM-dependent methyltransferase